MIPMYALLSLLLIYCSKNKMCHHCSIWLSDGTHGFRSASHVVFVSGSVLPLPLATEFYIYFYSS